MDVCLFLLPSKMRFGFLYVFQHLGIFFHVFSLPSYLNSPTAATSRDLYHCLVIPLDKVVYCWYLYFQHSLSLSTFTAKHSNSFFLGLCLLQGFLLKAGCCEIWDFIYHSSIASTVLQKSEKVRKMEKSYNSRFHTSSFLCKNWFSNCEQKKIEQLLSCQTHINGI